MTSGDRFAKRVFLGAAVYGIIVLLPQYFLEAKIGRDYPPPITHPEQFYGFIGVALAWQLVFLLMSRDIQRYRALILPAVLEKLAFGLPALVLYAMGRTAGSVAAVGSIDLVLGTLFVMAFVATRGQAGRAS